VSLVDHVASPVTSLCGPGRESATLALH